MDGVGSEYAIAFGRYGRNNATMGYEITIVCYEEHLKGFKRFAELANAVERWPEETSRRRAPPHPLQLPQQVQADRFFLTGIIMPVSPSLQGKTCKPPQTRKSADRHILTGIDSQA